ncbi:hypothetical protein ANCDUO_19496 [Ancylostoma duodenale]|uniref:Uncharacterized protein n=1 Tax=Ancylostoma duodenale TaxID=51022 RepID=A0A0C2FPI2_9BILA|nr:hypothetical protein ANCDUO_19496 [Ancylostoma duodenale]
MRRCGDICRCLTRKNASQRSTRYASPFAISNTLKQCSKTRITSSSAGASTDLRKSRKDTCKLTSMCGT